MPLTTTWDLRDLTTPPYVWGDFQDNIGLAKDASNRVTSFRNKGSAGGRWLPPDNDPTKAPTVSTVDGRQMAVYSSANGINTLNLDVSHTDTPMTVVMVWKTTTGARRDYQIIADFTKQGEPDTIIRGNHVNAANGFSSIDSGNSTVLPGSDQAGALNVLIFELNGASSRYYFNGSEVSFSPASRYATYGLALGGNRDGITSFFDGAIGEIAIMRGIFTGDEWERLTQSVMWKWGKEAAIPAGAKYKSAAPTRPLRRIRMDETNKQLQYCILSNHGMTAEGFPSTNTALGAFSTESRKTGKSYFEVTCTSATGNGFWFGLAAPYQVITNTQGNTVPGQNATDLPGFAVQFNGGRYPFLDGTRPEMNLSSTGAGLASNPAAVEDNKYSYPVTMGIAFDHDTGALYYRNEGGWYSDMNPSAGTGARYTKIREALVYIGGSLETCVATVNFGQTAFKFAIPTGFSPWQAEPVMLDTDWQVVHHTVAAAAEYTPSPYVHNSVQFPASDSLLIFDDRDGRGDYQFKVDGVPVPIVAGPFGGGSRFYACYVRGTGTAGPRQVTATSGAYWYRVGISVIRPTNLDISKAIGIDPGSFSYDPNERVGGVLYVPTGGLGLAIGAAGGTENMLPRWVDNSKEVLKPANSDPELVFASIRETSRTRFRKDAYAPAWIAGVSFAGSAAPVTSTRKGARSFRFL